MEHQQITKYNGFTTLGGNQVWAGALTLAWQQLIQQFIKQPIKIKSNDQKANKIVANFNTCQFSRKDIDQKCIYVKSGYGQQAVTVINKECKKKFPQKSFKDIEYKLTLQDIISYAYLLKKLEFQVKFEKNKTGNFVFEDKKVSSFYADNKKQKKQIRWFTYKKSNQFMISIDTKNPKDQIFFIKDKNVKCFDDAIQMVKTHGQLNGNVLGNDDLFEMPIVQLDVKRNLSELEGKQLNNKNLPGYMFAVVYEAVKLKIDEAGAKVQNQGVIMLTKCCIMKKQDPKVFHLNKQFWVVMKQQGKHPYFCALIKNPTDK